MLGIRAQPIHSTSTITKTSQLKTTSNNKTHVLRPIHLAINIHNRNNPRNILPTKKPQRQTQQNNRPNRIPPRLLPTKRIPNLHNRIQHLHKTRPNHRRYPPIPRNHLHPHHTQKKNQHHLAHPPIHPLSILHPNNNHLQHLQTTRHLLNRIHPIPIRRPHRKILRTILPALPPRINNPILLRLVQNHINLRKKTTPPRNTRHPHLHNPNIYLPTFPPSSTNPNLKHPLRIRPTPRNRTHNRHLVQRKTQPPLLTAPSHIHFHYTTKLPNQNPCSSVKSVTNYS